MDSLLRIFPQKRRSFWQKTADNGEKICEIRLRVDRPVIVETSRGDFFLNNGGEWQEHPYGAHLVTEAEIRELIAWLCQDSVYAYADEIRQGFLTVEGGHRIGLCGQAVLENETVIRTLKNIAFINIRVAHEIRGAADGILPKLYKEGKLQNTLIVSPPGFGKTTLLRDLIRQISDGNPYGAGLRVGVVDERSELAGSYLGRPQNDLGMRTDVLDGCPKAQGMLLLLRSMSPQVIAVDELGEETDRRALQKAAACGCGLLAWLLVRNNFWSGCLLSAGASLLYTLFSWGITYVLFRREHPFWVLLTYYLPDCLYTLLTAPLIYWGTRAVFRLLRKRQ